mmetsp:Transcript_7769/g.9662  ORF Transcript_7769/g.9662 Transcript_7769/m.9662 type:complete len:251 (-) Transcript_7769:1082-1834(-)
MHGPREFGADCLWKDLLNSQVHLLAPCHGNSGIHVVDLGGSKRHGLIGLFVGNVVVVPFDPVLDFDQLLLGGLFIFGHLIGTVLLHFAFLDRLQVPFQLLVVGFHLLALIFHPFHRLGMALGLSFLMVTQNCDLAICVVVEGIQLILGEAEFVLHVESVQLCLQCEGGIVGSEHLCGQVLHEGLEILVEVCWEDLVKDLCRRLLATDEALHVVKDLLGHFHTVGVSDGILSQEIQMDGQRLGQFQVLNTK